MLKNAQEYFDAFKTSRPVTIQSEITDDLILDALDGGMTDARLASLEQHAANTISALHLPVISVFRKVFVIRRSRHPDQPGESADNLSLSCPWAIEYDRHLYVGYSNNGGRYGNLNSAEMAVIPIEQLRME